MPLWLQNDGITLGKMGLLSNTAQALMAAGLALAASQLIAVSLGVSVLGVSTLRETPRNGGKSIQKGQFHFAIPLLSSD